MRVSCRPTRASSRSPWRNSQSLSGRFSLLAVTTLEKLLLSGELSGRSRGRAEDWSRSRNGRPRCCAPFSRPWSASLAIRRCSGVHFEESDEISIEGESSNVILDGETFRAEIGRPIFLKLAQPLSFVRIAA